MIGIDFNSISLTSDIEKAIQYSEGFLEGVNSGKKEMLKELGYTIKSMLEEFIDTSARVDSASLHHVYEWYMTGQSEGRLFNIECVVTNGGLTFGSTFSQSKTFSNGSTEVFYNKAEIMEKGVPVTITPKHAQVLAFSDPQGDMVFTKGPIVVNSPGGKNVQGSFHNIINDFFQNYFSQSMLFASGFSQVLENPIEFSNGFGKSSSRASGKEIGYNWIVKAGKSL